MSTKVSHEGAEVIQTEEAFTCNYLCLFFSANAQHRTFHCKVTKHSPWYRVSCSGYFCSRWLSVINQFHTTFLLWLPHDMTTTLSPSGLELIIPHTNYQRLPSQNTTTIVFKSHSWLWNWSVELCSCWPTLVWWKHSSISPASTSEHLSHLYLSAPDSVLREIWNIILLILFFCFLFVYFVYFRF